jgi:cytochrome b pre-mRNA-processing protein 3
LHVFLLVDRLRRCGAPAAEVSQALFDTYLRDLDGALREMGVGDLTVPKKMRRLGQAFYGRAKAYDLAFQAGGQQLEHALARTVFEEAEGADAAPLAAYAIRAREGLARQSTSALIAGEATWPHP